MDKEPFIVVAADSEKFIEIVNALYKQGFKIIDKDGNQRFKNLEKES